MPKNLVADGKRIRGANRNGDSHYETATLVEHGSGIPRASCSFYNESEELDVTRQLLSDVDITDRAITRDGLHSTFESVELILNTKRPTIFDLTEDNGLLRRMPAFIDAPFIVSDGIFVNPKFRGYRLPHDEETNSIQRGEHLRKQIKVHNARSLPLSRSARLHTTGFELFETPFHLNFQYSDTDTPPHFYEHCEKLIKDVTGCIEASALHHVYRDGVGYGTAGAGHYATSIHSDYSPCVENVTIVPKGHHFGLYTVWRSADSEQAIETMPLALCDRRTVATADIVYANVRRRTEQRTPVIECRLIHDLGQGWYYFPQMTPDEVLVFNQYDTRQKKANLRTTFHGAIKDPNVREDAPLRRTIEVRVLAIFEDLDLDSERRRAMYQAQVPSVLYDGTVSKWRHESMID